MAKKVRGKSAASSGQASPISQVAISGPAASILSLLDIGGMEIAEHSERQVGPDVWTVLTYSTAAAMREAQARGCTLHIKMTAEALAAHLKKVQGQVQLPKKSGRKEKK